MSNWYAARILFNKFAYYRQMFDSLNIETFVVSRKVYDEETVPTEPEKDEETKPTEPDKDEETKPDKKPVNPDVPDTGDEASLLLWSSLMLCAACAVWMLGRKKAVK
jgi:hypothetical protein